ncbi:MULTISPECIES: DUF317 domain-containing protein [Streptomyces]|uniref:DUF317 domain-containing protein n=1 Tax=Streptomyces ramulosus TaxID=47762 RepID=A0ABW1FVX3_9ACTN
MIDTTDDVYVSPRYLAGLPGHAGASFAPVAHWPHHHLDDGPVQLIVASPDYRVRIGWAGDDYDVWRISVAEDALSSTTWTARINQNTPPELVGGLVSALAAEWHEDSDNVVADTSYRWSDAVQPLLDAEWKLGPLSRGERHIVAPDHLAGATIDVVSTDPSAEAVTLWAGPPGWGTRAEAHFSARTPKRLIAAMAAEFVNPIPALRERATLHPRLAKVAQLTPARPPRPATPTPLDLRRATSTPPVPTTRSVPRWTTATPPPTPTVGPARAHR